MSMEVARDGTNPNNQVATRYKINCQRVSPTYELRRRGYDLQAGPNGTEAKPNHMQDQQIAELFIDPETGYPRVFNTAFRAGKSMWDFEDMVKDLEGKCPPGSRGFFITTWRSGSAHIMNWEVNEAGKVKFIEAQLNGPFGSQNLYDRASRISYNVQPGGYRPAWLRVDDLEPNWDKMKTKKVFEKKGYRAT